MSTDLEKLQPAALDIWQGCLLAVRLQRLSLTPAQVDPRWSLLCCSGRLLSQNSRGYVKKEKGRKHISQYIHFREASFTNVSAIS